MASQDVQDGSAKPGAFMREVWETVRTAGGGLALALALRVLIFEPHTIPTSSMEPGVVTGDYIVVSKWPYGWGRASIPAEACRCSRARRRAASLAISRRGAMLGIRLPPAARSR